MRRVPLLLSVALFACLTTPVAAQEHAHHASAERLGRVHFATSCAAGVAPTFDRAVALLHSFEFGGAIAGFGDVLAGDSSCAMAYWGIALSRWQNPMAVGTRGPALLRQGREAVDAGLRVADRASQRERLYLRAVGRLYDPETADQRTRVVAYERAMADLVAREPADTEAKIFHALALVASAPPTDKTYANQLRAGGVLEAIWAKEPDHPGLAHYIIHAYDAPPLAARAEAAARRYAAIAPSAAHALHMPSHTFTRVGEWDASIATNRRSVEVALHAGSIAEALHALDYAEYAYLQLARDEAARAVRDTLPALAARFDPSAVTGAAPGSAGVFALAAIPARWALERRDWKAAAALVPTPSAFPYTEAMTHFARALGASHLGDTAAARASVDSLGVIASRLQAAGEGYWAEQVAIQQLGAAAWLALAAQRTDSALGLMREAARREDATEKSAVTPGPLAPARELLGDMLLALHRPREALAEYRATLAKEPNRFRTLYGAAMSARAGGDVAGARRYAAQLRALTKHAETPRRPELASLP